MTFQTNILKTLVLFITFFLFSQESLGQRQTDFEKMRIGYALPLNKVESEKMNYASSVGVDCVEIGGFTAWINNDLSFNKTEEEITKDLKRAKKAANDAGIEIWSIHMPFGPHIDLSLVKEEEREKVVEAHKNLLEYLKILKPKVILFHPSYHLDPPGERNLRKDQLVKSVNELDKAVRAIGATMVVENMLGPELMIGSRERALLRTVEETVEMFDRFPNTVFSAIDMNHIKKPEILIRAMGSRLKTIHVADGTGEAENHWFPCDNKGNNDWSEILKALQEVNYEGPFLYESAYEDEKDFKECFETLIQEL